MNYKKQSVLFVHKRTDKRPLPARRRFQPTAETEEFLKECVEYNFDVSTVINMALNCFKPKLRPTGITWQGIESL